MVEDWRGATGGRIRKSFLDQQLRQKLPVRPLACSVHHVLLMMKTTTIITALLAAATIRTARADEACQDLRTVRSWEGAHRYEMQVGVTDAGAVVAWAHEEDDGCCTLAPVTFAQVSPAGIGASHGGERAHLDSEPVIAPLVGGHDRLVQMSTAQDVGYIVRKADGTIVERVQLDSYPPYGKAAPRASFDGRQFVLTWASGDEAGRRLRALRLDDQGVPLDATPVDLGPAFAYDTWNASARIGGVTWAIWSTWSSLDEQFVEGSAPDLVGVRISDDGTVLDAQPRVLVPGAAGTAIATSGDRAMIIVFVYGTGYRAVTMDGAGVVGAQQPVPVDEQHFLRGLLPAAESPGFTLWINHVAWAGDPGFQEAKLDVFSADVDGKVAAAPVMQLGGELRSIRRTADGYVLATVDEAHTADTGEQRAEVRWVRGATVAATTLESTALTVGSREVCFDPLPDHVGTGCQASGPAGAGTLALVAMSLGLVTVRRRRHA